MSAAIDTDHIDFSLHFELKLAEGSRVEALSRGGRSQLAAGLKSYNASCENGGKCQGSENEACNNSCEEEEEEEEQE